MRQLINYAILMVLTLVLPLVTTAQGNLTGIWRLKDSKKLKGHDYANAIPLIMTIDQKPDVITIETRSSLGDRDTVIRELLHYGIETSITKTGKKKVTSFQKQGEESTWLKQTEIFTKADTGKLQSLNKETFILWSDGNMLSLVREYVNHEVPKGNNEDFVIDGTYEKVSHEQLERETATGKGIHFKEGLTWEQIKSKAKKENKYIFVDCYATWCGPCKMMDKYVYPLNMIGEAMNNDFISVKVQMDSTKIDSEQIKMLYPLARKLEKEYSINALPSYLFFSPDGEIVHRGMGKIDPKDFMTLLTNAKDPQKQLYTLFNRAKQLQLPFIEYPALAKGLREKFGEKALANEVAGIYNGQYLNKLNEKELLTKNNLDFIGRYVNLVKSTDQIFQLCFKQPGLVDTIKEHHGGGWAEYIVNSTINREEIDPIFQEAEKLKKEPDWVRLEQQLSKKYNIDLAKTYTLDARVNWYIRTKNWVAYLKYIKLQLARHDLKNMDGAYLHWCAWYVFKYSEDAILLKEALGWMETILNNKPGLMFVAMLDTKACLLYKIGRKEESIYTLKKMQELDPTSSKIYQSRIDSMIKGEALWLTLN